LNIAICLKDAIIIFCVFKHLERNKIRKIFKNTSNTLTYKTLGLYDQNGFDIVQQTGSVVESFGHKTKFFFDIIFWEQNSNEHFDGDDFVLNFHLKNQI
jgi:hypothetical protein